MFLTEKYKKQIAGIISCYDRVILQANLSQWCYAEGMTSFAINNNIKIFDFPIFAQSLRDSLNKNILSVAEENNIQIEYIRRPSAFSKESNIQKIIAEKNIQQGIVHIYSVLEPCLYYKPHFNKTTKLSSLKTKEGICLHYYIYFIDKDYGLCFLRIPTYAPFRLQFYFNGHNLLAHKLKNKNIAYKMLDNAFLNIAGFDEAQLLSDNFRVEDLHQFLNILTDRYLPFLKEYNQVYRWSIMQAEYSTDIIFKNQSNFQLFYQDLIYRVTLSVKPDNISTFLGKKLSPAYQGEIGNNFNNNRILGTRIKHRKGGNYIKIYDKFSTILRIETTVNSVTDFNHFRQINKKDGTKSYGFAKMKKNIYSLYALGQLLKSSNNRYLEFISAFEDNTRGRKNLFNVSEPIYSGDRSLKGFNFFNQSDLRLLITISRGEFLINGFRNKDIRTFLSNLSSAGVSRILKRLLLHHIIKKVKNSYKYYITKFGKAIISTALQLKEFFIIPKLSAA
ncbi:MAG: MarR family transcriptional regulator [Candidatus Hydrogenedentota bacterium]